jgi:hypothetical protein
MQHINTNVKLTETKEVSRNSLQSGKEQQALILPTKLITSLRQNARNSLQNGKECNPERIKKLDRIANVVIPFKAGKNATKQILWDLILG